MGFPTPQFSASATGRLVVYQGAMLVHVDAANARTTLGLGTAALQNTGTSGANVPLLNAANTWSAAQSITDATASTSTTTGALKVTGGIGAQGDAFFGRNVWANGFNAQFVAEASSGNPRVLFNRGGVTKAYLDNNAGSFNVNSDATGTVGMYMLNSGSAWTAFSDARLPYKKTARPVTVLDKLGAIALYENEVNGRTELFVKAQEFHKAFPQLVKAGSDDPDYEPKGMADPESWGVSYERAGVAALQGLKELRAIVAALEEKIKGKKQGSNG